MQIIFNILLSASNYILIAYSFYLIYSLSKFFDLSHAAMITLPPYILYLFYIQYKLNLILSVILSIIITTIIILVIHKFIFSNLKKKKVVSWKLLVASLGLYVIIRNIISIMWGSEKISLRTWKVKAGYNIFGANITMLQIVTFGISLIIITSLILFIKYHNLGIKMQALASNEELANIVGIDINRIILIGLIISGFLISVAGILIGMDLDLSPDMGFNIFLFAVVSMIIGSSGRDIGIIFGAILLSILQHITSSLISVKWMDATAYIVLILVLISFPKIFGKGIIQKTEICI